MLVVYLVQSQGHLKGPHSVHVSSDDGDASVAALRVPEAEAPHQVHLKEANATGV